MFIDRLPYVHAYDGPLYRISDLVWFLTSQVFAGDSARLVSGPDTDVLTTEPWDVAFLRRLELECLTLNNSLIGVDTVFNKRLDLSGTVLKILPYETSDLIVYITTTAIYGVTLSTKAILSFATVSATCGCGDEAIIYYGTAAGVFSIALADLLVAGDRTAQAVLEINTASGTPILSNDVLDIDIFLNKFTVVSSGGCDYFSDWAGKVRHTYTLGTITKCGMGQYWFALSIADVIYTFWSATQPATFTTANATSHSELNVSYSRINQIEFEDGLFFATDRCVYIFDMDATLVRKPTFETVDVVAMYPAPMASVSGGGLVIGVKSLTTNEGRIEVFDLGA